MSYFLPEPTTISLDLKLKLLSLFVVVSDLEGVDALIYGG